MIMNCIPALSCIFHLATFLHRPSPHLLSFVFCHSFSSFRLLTSSCLHLFVSPPLISSPPLCLLASSALRHPASFPPHLALNAHDLDSRDPSAEKEELEQLLQSANLGKRSAKLCESFALTNVAGLAELDARTIVSKLGLLDPYIPLFQKAIDEAKSRCGTVDSGMPGAGAAAGAGGPGVSSSVRACVRAGGCALFSVIPSSGLRARVTRGAVCGACVLVADRLRLFDDLSWRQNTPALGF